MSKQKTPLFLRKLNKKVVESNRWTRIQKWLFPLMIQLTKKRAGYRVVRLNRPHALSDRPIIFAANHSNYQDVPIALRGIGRQTYILVGQQKLKLIDKIVFELLGAIWVDRKSKEDSRAAKDAITERLVQGSSVLWFPEGSWNLSDHLIMLPMKWGIIDVARRAEAQIIPLILDYDKKTETCYIRYGKPFLPQGDKKEDITALRDQMAGIRWRLWEEKGIYSRKQLDVAYEKKRVLNAITEYAPLDWEYEKDIIFWPYEPREPIFLK